MIRKYFIFKITLQIPTVVLVLIFALGMNIVKAESANIGKRIVTVDEARQLLIPEVIPDEEVRSISRQEAPEKDVQITIEFAYDSDILTSISKRQLDPFGEAMQEGGTEDIVFVVEGHTDAAGAESYNMELSYRRAKSVNNYLIQAYNIPNNRFKVEGKGEYDLYNKSNPLSSENRRVHLKAKRVIE